MSATDTREQWLAPLRERLMGLIDERLGADVAPSVRAFARAYLRRGRGADDSEPSAEALFDEIASLYAFVAARGTEPIAVRAFTPRAGNGGAKPHGSVVEANTRDLPFLVDSLTAELEARGLLVERVLHPIVGIERNAAGRIVRVRHPRDAAVRESVMHFDLDRRLPPAELAAVEAALREVLESVHRCVDDFPALTARVPRMIEIAAGAEGPDPEDVDETLAFLDWLLQGNFIFLGYREYDIGEEAARVVPGSGLGLLADEATSAYAEPVSLDQLPPLQRERATTGDVLVVSKTNRLSPVHKRARMDYVAVRRLVAGRVVLEARMLGLFTTKAYAEPAEQTPLLARKLRRILVSEDLIEGSHDYKAAVSLFGSFPKDELFAAPQEDLRRAIVALLGLHGNTVRLLGRRDPDGRSASLIASMPATRSTPELLDRLSALLRRRFDTKGVEAHRVYAEPERVHVHATVHRADGLPDVSFRDLEREVVALTRSWHERLREQLVRIHGARLGSELAASWGPRFPDHYRAQVEPESAVRDIACFQRLADGDRSFVVDLHPEPAARGGRTLLSLYKMGEKVELSEVMPMLEDLGLRVIEEVATRLRDDEYAETWVQEFVVLGSDDCPLDLEDCGERVADTVGAVWGGECESDTLNRLVMAAGLDWRQLTLLRAYRRYRQRIGSRFTESYQNDVLAANAAVTAKLVRYFELRFDPAHPRDEAGELALREEILGDLDEVASLDHDRILRNQLLLIDATLRTNAYRPGREVITFKLRSGDVPAMPQPAPWVEIYVYSAAMEGIHLRGGRIARGGIRFSDRMDYRTEVFGLMRAQLAKNAVIVPEGAKGGFILKAPPAGRAELAREVERQYVAYIRGLLEVTDNLVDGEVRHPDGVRVLDEPDTYLVVAADKGTATLSDTANRVAVEQEFWLGDAFASGGRTGYDHKALGITARGAWESVKRHLSELDLDPERDVFTAVGIGDMSGDVFGNGMLLSDRVRLVAAYDHRHVFIDPDPDPAASFAERRRLFELGMAGGSTWDDYDRAAISAGGGVWPRSAKSIALSEEARAALGTEDERLAPADVIRAILRAPVDLLFNGGIGTVVKASTETDDDAKDRASDSIRVDADELRCRVVAEGGNLGLTRRARVEFARRGGRVNADFIDNSAGVDCSDHEVNLKILLDLAVRGEELDADERDQLLRDVTGDVVAHVLYGSFLQAQILSDEVAVAPRRMDAYEELMSALEADGLLDRAAEALPTTEELAERRRVGEGVQRPELALLLAYAKLHVTRALLESDLPDDPFLERDLRDYFPSALVERFGHRLADHPLRRQLIATIEANLVVNSMGPTFVSELSAECGVLDADVVGAFRAAEEVTGADDRWDVLERLPHSVDRDAVAELMAGVSALVEAITRRNLTSADPRSIGEAIEADREAFARLAEAMPRIGTDEWRARREATVEALRARGVPEDLARAHAVLGELVQAPGLIAVARAGGHPVELVAEASFLLGERLRLNWLAGELDGLPVDTRTRRWAVRALHDDLLEARCQLVARALALAGDVGADAAVEALMREIGPQRARLDRFLRSLALERAGGLPALTLAVRQLRTLADA